MYSVHKIWKTAEEVNNEVGKCIGYKSSLSISEMQGFIFLYV